MREKLTVIKVGGKIVEEEATLRQLLTKNRDRKSSVTTKRGPQPPEKDKEKH